jgi:N-acetylmuramoyl-L-alanine amidase CwlA
VPGTTSKGTAITGVQETYSAVIGPSKTISNTASVARQTATAQAFQSVAQSSAFAVENATTYLTNITLISLAAIAVAATKMAEDPVVNIPKYTLLLEQVTKLLSGGLTQFTNVGSAASQVIKDFPSS